MKRKAAQRESPEPSSWEQPRKVPAAQQEAQQRAAQLPVRGADGNDEWVVGVQLPLNAAAPSVAGITVIDDLAAELQRQRQRQQDERQRQEEVQRLNVTGQPAAKKKQAAPPTGLDALNSIQSQELRRQAAKQQLATSAQQLLQDPEKHLPQLKLILELMRDQDSQVCRLTMLTLLAVFKDIIPAYRIRPTHDEPEDKLSKEVRALRNYESALLNSYHAYLKGLLQAYKGSNASQAPVQQGRIAVKCMAGLLIAAPHFNYRSDLMQALVSCLGHKDEQIRQSALEGLTSLLGSSQGDGEVATETVQLVADVVRRFKCVMAPTTLDCLLGLRFPDMVAPPTPEDRRRKKKKQGERDEVGRSFLEAQAAADLASRRANQTATLDALFEVLFRVLKHCSGSGLIQQPDAPSLSRRQFLKKYPLLFPALRILSRFVHLISLDYLQDIAAELRRLLLSTALPPQERLRVLLTAVEMMAFQGNVLSLENIGFHTELYAALQHSMLVPLLEPPAQQGTAGSADNKDSQPDQLEDDELLEIAATVESQLGAKAGEQVCFLVPQVLEDVVLQSRTLDIQRQAAFAKRMLISAASTGDTGLTMGLLCLLHRMLRRSRRLQVMLQHEEGGPAGQSYRPEAEDPSEAGALGAPLWELSLLAQHFHPHVSTASRQLAAGSPPATLPLTGSTAAFAAAYSTVAGGFTPLPK